MLASELANAVLVQHFVLGVLAYLLGHFGGLLKKLLFLGRMLLLQLWVLGTHVRKRLGRRLARRWLVETVWAAWEARSEAWAAWAASSDAAWKLARRRLLGWLVGWLVGWLAGWLVSW